MKFVAGSVFDSGCEVLVNPVNCVGVCGKGLAKQFREKYPENYRQYKLVCQSGSLEPGSIFVHRPSHTLRDMPVIINAATKMHWRDPSRIEYVQSALINIRERIESGKFKSIAIPKLGCGLGGLDWCDVKRDFQRILGRVDQAEILVYE